MEGEMKTLIYLIFFGITSVMLLACGGDKKADSDGIESTTEKSTESMPTVDQTKKEVTVDPALSAKLETGEKLVTTHCSSCHQAEMYTRAESKIKSVDALLTQVKACDANIGSGLFDEDMVAITAYLEVNFYKFAK
jgi:cytochrome c553